MHKSLVLTTLGAVLLGACAATVTPQPPSIAAPTSVLVASVVPGTPPRTDTSTPSPAAMQQATAFPDPGRYTWAGVAAGFESPVDIQFAPDGSARMFVVEQSGRIRIFDPSEPARGPFLDLTDRVNARGNEQGLLGLAFHPRFADNGLFYVNYTDYGDHNVIARFRISGDPNFADPATEVRLLSIDDPFSNHNGGVLAFGPDGYLYAGLGDGGSANDPFGNGQNTNSLLGKVLRLDVDGSDPYAVPADNPFAQGGGSPEVWAYGLRNPWRMSFDAATGDLYIADVGQGTWEELNFLPAGSAGGANFGWKYREGAHEFAGDPPPGSQLLDPVAEYSHNEGDCSITGGYVYRGAMTEWNGIYFYADYCTGKLWGLLPPSGAGGPRRQSALLYQTGANVTTFGQDPGGELYFADRAGGIFRLEALP